ncbi:hypothetical protein [Ideonella sp.]|uniref:hypothetical protein n=1 Tax=Ideonella sp. TaxID=1929293 RepID=UPI0039C859B1
MAPLSTWGRSGGNSSFAVAINGRGHVVGWAETADFRIRAFLYRGGELKDLGTLGGLYGEATSMNNFGQIVAETDSALNQLVRVDGGERCRFVWHALTGRSGRQRSI